MTSYLTNLDPADKRPQYVQIAERIEQAITAGDLSVDAPVPSGPELVQRYGVALMTARQALDHLHKRGLISRGQGRRSTVLRKPEDWPEEGGDLAARLARIEWKLDRVLQHLQRND